MAAVTLPVGSLIFFEKTVGAATSWQALSEHNRLGATLDTIRIEKSQRMSNGTLRKIFIADKDTLSVSWTDLPSDELMTVDLKWGAMDIKSFYETTGQGVVNVKVSPNGVAAREKTMTMSFTSANFIMKKRNVKMNGQTVPQEFWDVSISLEEV
jgi:hypothetical protein